MSVLEVSNLTKNYGKKLVLKGINFSLKAQEIVAFLGPNGAGKSTTLKMIMGLRKPAQGAVSILGFSPDKFEVKNKIGYTSQELDFPAFLQVKEILKFVHAHYAEPVSIQEILQRFSLTELQHESAGGLSGGEKRRLGLACALLGRPKLLILDEPSTGLDIESRNSLWKEITKFREDGGTILLSTHDLNEVEVIADRVLLIDEGQILIDGTIAEIKKRIEFQKISFECDGKHFAEMVQDADAYVRQLVTSKPNFSKLEIHPITLEEAFLKIRSRP